MYPFCYTSNLTCWGLIYMKLPRTKSHKIITCPITKLELLKPGKKRTTFDLVLQDNKSVSTKYLVCM